MSSVAMEKWSPLLGRFKWTTEKGEATCFEGSELVKLAPLFLKFHNSY